MIRASSRLVVPIARISHIEIEKADEACEPGFGSDEAPTRGIVSGLIEEPEFSPLLARCSIRCLGGTHDLFPPSNGSALSCEPQCLRGSTEAPTFDARRYHGAIEARCGSSAAAPC